MQNSDKMSSRRDFIKKSGVLVASLVVTGGASLYSENAFAYELPSAVQAEDGILQTAWAYINIPDSYKPTGGIGRDEAIAHILGINLKSRGHPDFRIVPYSKIGLTSPVYFILRNKMRNGLIGKESQRAIEEGNIYVENLLYGIGNLVSGKYMEARDYFAQSIFEIARLNEADFKQIEKAVGTAVDRSNFYKTFNSMSFEHRTWILNNVVWNKVKDMPMPKDQYDPADKGLALKNFYYSLGLLYWIDGTDQIKNNSNNYLRGELEIYNNFYKKFNYHTCSNKLLGFF